MAIKVILQFVFVFFVSFVHSFPGKKDLCGFWGNNDIEKIELINVMIIYDDTLANINKLNLLWEDKYAKLHNLVWMNENICR